MEKSRLLLKEQPIVINKELAKIIGLNEAIVLQQIEYWLNLNEITEKDTVFKNGYYWTYQKIEKWTEQFPFWSYDTVKRTLKKLRDKNILITDRFNEKEYDRTIWYRIDYAKLNEIENNYNKKANSAKCTNEENSHSKKEKTCKPLKKANSAKCPNGIVQNAPMEQCKMPQPIQETIQETKNISSSTNETKDLYKVFEDNICKLTITKNGKGTRSQFKKYLDNYDYDFLLAVLEYCYTKGEIRSFKGFKKVIDSYIEKNVLTRETLLKDIQEWYKKGSKKKSNSRKTTYNKVDKFNDFEQRQYDFEDLEEKLLKPLSKHEGELDSEELKRKILSAKNKTSFLDD